MLRRCDVEVESFRLNISRGGQRLGSLSHAMDTAIGNADEDNSCPPRTGRSVHGRRKCLRNADGSPKSGQVTALIGKLGQGGNGAFTTVTDRWTKRLRESPLGDGSAIRDASRFHS